MKRETHLGKVLANADPAKAGGAKVAAFDLVDGPLDPEDFFPTRFPIAGDDEGFYFAPPKGGLVELEAASDDEESVEDVGAVVVGMRFSKKDKIPSEFRSDPVERGGIKWGDDVLLFDRAKALLALISANVRLGEENAAHPVLRGDSFNSELSTFLDAMTSLAGGMKAAFTTLSGVAAGPLAPLKPGFDAAVAAWTTFEPTPAAFKSAATTWLSTKVKTE